MIMIGDHPLKLKLLPLNCS